ncbi:hypothetical protein DV096_01310 [Bradymonadaceae bacterium TMQ3]|nr:hypothetical protein DV096_01310 [Bradymonadaceae bacterium TMQ3]TXC78012.1 hypothetical protein FRC91_04590 [Bradymonadales bacterium TMQ1]
MRNIHPRLVIPSIAMTLAFTLLMPATTAFAGAWTQPDRGFYAKLSVGHARADQQYKETGETFQLLSDDVAGTFASTAAFGYAEYGLLPRLTLYGSAAFQSLTLESDLQRARVSGLGDVWLGARASIIEAPVVLSAYGATKSPTGYTADPDPMVPTLGNGVREHEFGLSLGASLWPRPFYASMSVGYRLRGDRQAAGGDRVNMYDEIPIMAEVGWAPHDAVWVRGVAQSVIGLGPPEALDIFNLTPLTQSYLKVGPSVIASIPGGVQLSLDLMLTPWGVNTVQSTDLILGVAYEFAP